MQQVTQEDSLLPMLLTVSQAMKTLNVGRSKFYELVAKESLPVVRSGRWVRVSRKSLEEWVKKQEQQG